MLKLRSYMPVVGKVFALLMAFSSIVYMGIGRDFFLSFNRRTYVAFFEGIRVYAVEQDFRHPHRQLLLQSFVVLILTLVANFQLKKRFEFTHWWVGRLIRKKKSPGNLVEVLMQLPWVWPITCIAVLFALPSLAHAEEMMFRGYISSAEEALLMSAAFGLVHMITLVPLHQAMSMFIPALWFSYLFMRHDGLAAPVMSHFSYNVILVTFMVLVLSLKRLKVLGNRFLSWCWPTLLRI